jgi:hypothetical protein
MFAITDAIKWQNSKRVGNALGARQRLYLHSLLLIRRQTIDLDFINCEPIIV